MAPNDETSKGSILIVDDEPLKRITLQIELTEAGYQVYETAEAKTALRVLASRPIDVVVTDLKMPGMDGLMFLEHVKRSCPDVPVILMTAFATVDTAVAAMKRGAFDYLTKPFTADVLLGKIEQLLSYRRSASSSADPADEAQGTSPTRPDWLVGSSHAMRHVFSQIQTAAQADGAVLVRGEGGTGKELVAEAIHRLGPRSHKPLVKVNCASLQDDLLEGELFGRQDDTPTDPPGGRPGRFAMADGGTLFLDEVDAIPMACQVKVLRSIEQQTVEPIGGREPLRLDIRLICATEKDLQRMVDAGRFRSDLYYRLKVVSLTIPPLRDRPEDIPVLAAHFIELHARATPGAERPTLSPHALDLLATYHWPGNARELEQAVQRALAVCQDDAIRPEHLPPLGEQATGDDHALPLGQAGAGLTETVASIERQMILSALVQSDFNQAKAAQILGIPRTTLRDKIAKYRLSSGPPSVHGGGGTFP